MIQGHDLVVTRQAIAARPPTIRLAGRRRVRRARRLRSGGYIQGAVLADSLGGLCQAMVTAGFADCSLEIREGRDMIAFVLSFHATASVAARAAEADRQPPRKTKSPRMLR